MAGPWEKYADDAAADTSKPWEKYAESKPEPEQKPKPSRSFGQELGRQAGLTGRYVAEGLSGLADPLNQALGLQPLSQVVGRGLTKLGVPEEETPTERMVGAASRGVVGAALPGGLAKAAAPIGEVGKGISAALQARPAAQAAAGVTGGLAGQGAAEMKLPAPLQTGAALAGGMLPFALPSKGIAKPPNIKEGTFEEARRHGYVVTPTAVEKSMPGNVMESITSKVKLTAKTSAKNAEARASDIRTELGLGKGGEISASELDQVRDNAYDQFKALVGKLKGVGGVKPTPEFQQRIQSIIDETAGMQSKYPEIIQAPTRKRLEYQSKALLRPHDAQDTLELIKSLRRQSTSNLSAPHGARPEPFKEAMGQFQYKAANALEDLMEQNLQDPAAVNAMREARQTIAKTYDVQYALRIK